MSKQRVLILCTGNSARSQMAEGLVSHFMGDRWEAYSAGTRPAGYIHPLAVEAMSELGIDISLQRSKSVEQYREAPWNVVITVCDQAASECPLWLGPGTVKHISFPDPAAIEGSYEERLAAFRTVRDGIRKDVLGYLDSLGTRKLIGGVNPREAFEWDLHRLQEGLQLVGTMVIHAVRDSVHALFEMDEESARKVIAADRRINEKRFEIEAYALRLIALQAPVASDLRLIAAVLDVSAELERMGDYAKGIARITLMLKEDNGVIPPADIRPMSEKVCEMIAQALNAFALRDVELARALPAQDDEVDMFYNKIYHDLLDLIFEDRAKIDQANMLTWVAHNLERAADRVTNICERVVFTATGQFTDFDDES
jgi:phosphate transport system protein